MKLSLDKLTIFPNEVESCEKSSDSSLSEGIVFFEHLVHTFGQYLLHFLYMAACILLNHVLNNLITGNTGNRMCLESSTPSESISPEVILNVFAEAHCG